MADPVIADVQRVVQDWLERPGATTAELAADMQRLIADAEKRAAAAAREPFEALLAKWDETIAHYGVPTTAPLYRSAEELRAALDPAGAASGEAPGV